MYAHACYLMYTYIYILSLDLSIFAFTLVSDESTHSVNNDRLTTNNNSNVMATGTIGSDVDTVEMERQIIYRYHRLNEWGTARFHWLYRASRVSASIDGVNAR